MEAPTERGGGAAGAETPHPLSAGHAQRPERTLTELFVITGVAFAFIGSAVGALYLGQLSGVQVGSTTGLFPSHPYLQVYGFLASFVVGIEYSLLPRFKVGNVPGVVFGYVAYALITSANVCFILYSVLPAESFPSMMVGSGLVLAGSIVFFSQAATLVSRPSGGFPEASPLIALSAASLVLMSFLMVVEAAWYPVLGETFSPQMVLLALVGFAGSMIYAVEIRSVGFRQSDYRKKWAKLCWALQGTGIGGLFVGVLAGSTAISLLGAAFLLGAAGSQLVAVKILELAHPLMH
ncbi:MAG: hypothetical protein KGI26_03170, partial [Thaumarchaeota archaeon]|nr:hypothetical protein [Nitrososphaerota archaeon]